MSPQPAPVNTPIQLPLIPPEVLRITLSIGICDGGNHVQFQGEVWDDSSSILIAMRSHPSVIPERADEVFDGYVAAIRQWLLEALHPFQ